MKGLPFTISDTIAGYVGAVDRAGQSFTLTTSGGDEYTAYLAPNLFARFAFNLDEPYADCTGRIGELLKPGQFVYVYGVFYPQGEGMQVRGQVPRLPRRRVGVYRQEEPNWWVQQIRSIADSYLKWQFNYSRTAARSTTATTAPICTSPAARTKTTSCRRPTPSPAWSTAWPPPTC